MIVINKQKEELVVESEKPQLYNEKYSYNDIFIIEQPELIVKHEKENVNENEIVKPKKKGKVIEKQKEQIIKPKNKYKVTERLVGPIVKPKNKYKVIERLVGPIVKHDKEDVNKIVKPKSRCKVTEKNII